MKQEDIRIRAALCSDAEELRDIYAPYVLKTAISFEYEAPSLEEFQKRISQISQRNPYLLAEKDGEILGYAHTRPFVGRPAYDWSVETTIYLKENRRNMGIGKRLYHALEKVSAARNILNMNACIGYPETEDEYLTKNSARFHEHLGYRLVGRFYKCGYKFGRWYDMVWMEKIIGSHEPQPAPVLPVSALDLEKILEEC